MKIVTLIEDSQRHDHLGSEHGVSFYIETNTHKLLFDVGQSCLFIANAKRLGIQIEDVDTVIISHGHYDHGGGLKDFLRVNKQANIYIQKTAFDEYYSMRKENEYTYIGLNKDLDMSRFILLEGNHQIDEELTIINDIEEKAFFPNSNHTMYRKQNNQFISDDFSHEQNLLICSEEVRVLFAGCAHKGIVNIINQAEKALNNKKINAVLGGFHLKSRLKQYKESEQSIETIARVLKQKSIEHYYTGHCTGDEAFDLMKSIMKERLNRFYPGLVIDLN